MLRDISCNDVESVTTTEIGHCPINIWLSKATVSLQIDSNQKIESLRKKLNGERINCSDQN